VTVSIPSVVPTSLRVETDFRHMTHGNDSSEASETANTTGTNPPEPLLRRAGEESYETVDAAEGLEKGTLIAAEHGAPRFALRRFTLDAGGSVPRHTNEIEHEQYVLGVGEEEHVVAAGDSLLIPAGVTHWYRNESDSQGAFLCAVPNGDDEIRLAENE
jgi:quercetin dioxygenase-like cupin family protein